MTDFLIIGQGLCGTWLSYYLLKAGASVMVIDHGTGHSASRAASGIINPITGKRLARQWMAETILPFAAEAYREMGATLHAELAKESSIHNFFSNAEEAAFFAQKAATTHEDLLSYRHGLEGNGQFNFHYGIGTIQPVLLVDVPSLLREWRGTLASSNRLLEESFDWTDCKAEEHCIRYRHVRAKAVIDCSGAAAIRNPLFSRLPFALNKGEAVLAEIPGVPRDAIYKHAQLSIVPWNDDRLWIGSSYDWDFTDELPTQGFLTRVENILRQWLRLPFSLHEHFAAIRPATVTRDAFCGLHPHHPRIGILNGMGSKGCSLAPFLAHNLANHLTEGSPLIAQVDIKRYERILG